MEHPMKLLDVRSFPASFNTLLESNFHKPIKLVWVDGVAIHGAQQEVQDITHGQPCFTRSSAPVHANENWPMPQHIVNCQHVWGRNFKFLCFSRRRFPFAKNFWHLAVLVLLWQCKQATVPCHAWPAVHACLLDIFKKPLLAHIHHPLGTGNASNRAWRMRKAW